MRVGLHALHLEGKAEGSNHHFEMSLLFKSVTKFYFSVVDYSIFDER